MNKKKKKKKRFHVLIRVSDINATTRFITDQDTTYHIPTLDEIVNRLLPRDDQASSAPLKAAQDIT